MYFPVTNKVHNSFTPYLPWHLRNWSPLLIWQHTIRAMRLLLVGHVAMCVQMLMWWRCHLLARTRWRSWGHNLLWRTHWGWDLLLPWDRRRWSLGRWHRGGSLWWGWPHRRGHRLWLRSARDVTIHWLFSAKSPARKLYMPVNTVCSIPSQPSQLYFNSYRLTVSWTIKTKVNCQSI